MLRRFEALLDPTAGTPAPPPNAGLTAFYWFYIRQVRGLTVALFVFGGLIAILDTLIPAFIGRLVSLVSTHTPQTLFRDDGWVLLGMGAVLMLVRPLCFVAHNVLVNQIVNPGFSNMIRWQNHWHVVRQSWTFFPERFHRPYRQPGAANRPSVAREPGHARSMPPGIFLSTAPAPWSCLAAWTGG